MKLSRTNVVLIIVTIVAVLVAAFAVTRPDNSLAEMESHEMAQSDPCEVQPGTERPNYCGPSEDSASPEPQTRRNPVEILKMIPRCSTDAVGGETDIDGDRYAECEVPNQDEVGGYNVNVRTYLPGDPKLSEPVEIQHSDDLPTVYIVGEDFTLFTSNIEVKQLGITPERLAELVDGELLTSNNKIVGTPNAAAYSNELLPNSPEGWVEFCASDDISQDNVDLYCADYAG